MEPKYKIGYGENEKVAYQKGYHAGFIAGQELAMKLLEEAQANKVAPTPYLILNKETLVQSL